MTLKEHFLLSFERFSNKIAFYQPLFEKETLKWRGFTYGEVKNLSIKFASFIKENVPPFGRVILFAENSPYWCIAYIGIILGGAIAVPIDVETDRETLENIIRDSEPSLLLCSSKTEAFIDGFRGFNIEKIEELFLDDGATVQDIPEIQISEDSVASIIYTSGTTGTPKAVMLTHRNFSFEIEAGKKTGIIKNHENVLCILPLHHTYPFVCNFLVPFAVGATITFSPYLKGPEVLKIIKEKKVTSIIAVPQVLEMMRFRIKEGLKALPFFIKPLLWLLIKLSSFLRRRFDINIGKYLFFFVHLKTGYQLRLIASGGARLAPEIMIDLEALGFTIIEGYGLTETSPVVTFNPLKKRKPGSVGKPLEGVELKIIELDSSGTSPPAGEIAIRGPLVMKGYYKNEKLTKEVIKDGWLLSGDLGYIDSEGYLFITGRKKDVIVLSSGKTIYPEDLEERYRKAIPLIKEICLLEGMMAVIVPDIDFAKKNGIVNIHSHLKWELDSLSKDFPPYMRIKGFVLHNEPLPKTRLGKFKRFMIKELILKKEKEERPPDPAMATEMGKAIEEVIQSILPVKNIYLTDHLELDLGMDSLKRLEFAEALERRFSVKITDNLLSRWHIVRDVLEDIERLSPSEKEREGFENRSIFRLINYLILRPGHFILRTFFRLFYDLKVEGLQNIPSSPFIITPNHTSFLDGFVVFASLPFHISRALFFQGLRKYFPFRSLSRLINVISISSDKELVRAMDISKELINKGFSLCIFPEGGRSFDGELREFMTGFALLSIETRAPVVPVYIDGPFRILPRGRLIPRKGRIRVYIDKPIVPPPDLKEALYLRESVRKKINSLKQRLSLS